MNRHASTDNILVHSDVHIEVRQKIFLTQAHIILTYHWTASTSWASPHLVFLVHFFHYVTDHQVRWFSSMVEKKEVGTYFPGDPRFAGYGFPVHEEDYKALCDDKMLSTNLLDYYLIQHESPPPSSSSAIAPAMMSTSQSSLSIFIGGLSTMKFIQQCNELVATPFLAKRNAKKVTKIRASLGLH